MESKLITVFAYFSSNRHKSMLPASTAPPSQVAPPPEQSHIPLPCEAVSPPLPFGTGHETNITIRFFNLSFLEHRVVLALKFEIIFYLFCLGRFIVYIKFKLNKLLGFLCWREWNSRTYVLCSF